MVKEVIPRKKVGKKRRKTISPKRIKKIEKGLAELRKMLLERESRKSLEEKQMLVERERPEEVGRYLERGLMERETRQALEEKPKEQKKGSLWGNIVILLVIIGIVWILAYSLTIPRRATPFTGVVPTAPEAAGFGISSFSVALFIFIIILIMIFFFPTTKKKKSP